MYYGRDSIVLVWPDVVPSDADGANLGATPRPMMHFVYTCRRAGDSRDSGPFDGKRLVCSCGGAVCPSLEHVFDRSRDPVAGLMRESGHADAPIRGKIHVVPGAEGVGMLCGESAVSKHAALGQHVRPRGGTVCCAPRGLCHALQIR